LSFNRGNRGKVQHTEKFGTLGKVRRTSKNAAPLRNAEPMEKYGTLGKMQHTWKRAARFEKRATLG